MKEAVHMRGEMGNGRYSLWFTMCYPEVEIDARDKHVGFEPNFVYTRRRKRDRQSDHPHERRGRFPRVAERVLRPQSTEQQNNLQITW